LNSFIADIDIALIVTDEFSFVCSLD